MFGSDNSLNTQLVDFKNTIIGLYKLRTKLIAERESKRFRYITDMKAKLSSISSQIYNKLYADRNYAAQDLFNEVFSKFAQNLPMVDLQGRVADGNGNSLYALGGKYNVSFLSPIAHILNSPYDDSTSDPMYKAYGQYLVSITPESVMNQFIFNRMPSFYNDAYQDLTLPPTRQWVEGLQLNQTGTNLDEFDYLMSVMNSYGLFEQLGTIYQTLENIILLTQDIINVQFQIDQTEESLTLFLNEHSEFSGGLSSSQVLQEIRDQAEGKIPVDQPPIGTIVATSAPNAAAPLAEENSLIVGSQAEAVQPVVLAQKKSALPWAAAAIGIFLLARK